jgi:hypothetical protein
MTKSTIQLDNRQAPYEVYNEQYLLLRVLRERGHRIHARRVACDLKTRVLLVRSGWQGLDSFIQKNDSPHLVGFFNLTRVTHGKMLWNTISATPKSLFSIVSNDRSPL